MRPMNSPRQLYSTPRIQCAAVWMDRGRSVRCRRRAVAYRPGYYVGSLGLIFVCRGHYDEWGGTHDYIAVGDQRCAATIRGVRCGAHHANSIHRPDPPGRHEVAR